jgi:hypothetical protein
VVLDQQQGLISLDNSGTPSTPSGPTFLLNQTIDSSVASPLSSSDWVSSTGGVVALFSQLQLGEGFPNADYAFAQGNFRNQKTSRHRIRVRVVRNRS